MLTGANECKQKNAQTRRCDGDFAAVNRAPLCAARVGSQRGCQQQRRRDLGMSDPACVT